MVVAPGRMIDKFLPISDAEYLPLYRLVLRLACVCALPVPWSLLFRFKLQWRLDHYVWGCVFDLFYLQPLQCHDSGDTRIDSTFYGTRLAAKLRCRKRYRNFVILWPRHQYILILAQTSHLCRPRPYIRDFPTPHGSSTPKAQVAKKGVSLKNLRYLVVYRVRNTRK